MSAARLPGGHGRRDRDGGGCSLPPLLCQSSGLAETPLLNFWRRFHGSLPFSLYPPRAQGIPRGVAPRRGPACPGRCSRPVLSAERHWERGVASLPRGSRPRPTGCRGLVSGCRAERGAALGTNKVGKLGVRGKKPCSLYRPVWDLVSGKGVQNKLRGG